MNSTARLNAAQAKLEELGYVDLKFFFKLGLDESAKSDVENNLASSLEKFLDGDYKESAFTDVALLSEPRAA